MHVAEPPVAHGAEALEDGAVQDVGADRVGRLEAEPITRMGVSSAPPPMPVSPTRTPIRSPVRVNCQVNRCPCQRRCRASGSRAPSQRPRSTAARLVCLAKGEVGLWRRVIAGQRPASVAGRGTYARYAWISTSATSGRENSVGGSSPASEHLSHLRAREEDVVVSAVRAGLRRGHRTARLAPERVLEEHRLDVELVRLELVEDQLRVVGAVVVARHPRGRGRR